MDKPDKIWAYGAFKDKWEEDGGWSSYTPHPTTANVWVNAPYLLATPERELASELVEALTAFTEFFDKAMEGFSPDWSQRNKEENALGWNNGSIKVSDFLKARAVLAKLEKGNE